jgi:predicted metal-dependent hydrolase
MRVLMVVFIVSTGIETVLSILGDPATYRPGVLARSLVFARRSPIFTAKTWGRLAAYNRRGFHPDDRDTSALVAEWRELLFGDDGEMVDKLATAAA